MSATAAPAKKKKSETGTGGSKAGAGAGAGAAAEKEKPATETIHDIEEKTKNLVKSDSSAGAAALGFLELKEDSKVTVPNVASKLSDKEQARLQAQIGNLQKVGAIFVTNESKETKKFETKTRETELKNVPTIYFKSCSECEYTVSQRTVKVLIENCKNTTITLEGDVLTRTVEMWKCENVQLKVKTSVKTLQLDLSQQIKLHFEKTDHMGALVWAHVEDAHLTFGDGKEHDLKTGFKEMLKEHPDSHKDVDQFIVRFLEGKLTPERCVRLKNGFLSTEREAVEWEKRNEIKKTAYVEEFLKSAGVHLNKSKGGKKVQPNEPCSCGSGKKFKKCCMGKVTLTGVEGDETKAVV